MENLEKIESMLKTSEAIKKAFNSLDNYAKDRHHHDKVGFTFNEDDRFKTGEPLSLWVSSWHGVYGNSGCSSFFSIPDPKLFNNYLLSVLCSHFRNILEEVAAKIEEDAAKLSEKALTELETKAQLIKNLKEKAK